MGHSLAIIMGQVQSLLIMALFLSAGLCGCLSETRDSQEIELEVNHQVSNGTIIESYSDGEKVSTDNVVIDFDFSNTISSSELITFGIDKMDGSTPVEIDADLSSIISLEFSYHGIYGLSAYAIDVQENKQNISILIKIDLVMEWTEFNTNNPSTLTFDPTPSNEGHHPFKIEIESTVENPSLIDEIGGGGQSVQFTWNIADQNNDVCQSRNGQANDGESDTWNAIHFDTYGIHELRITYEDGQDYVSIDQTVSIIYDLE